jgi:hypothetical protein
MIKSVQRRAWLGAALAVSAGAGLSSGCALLREIKTPVDVLWDRLPGNPTGKALVVFLPGAQEVPQDLVTQGFLKQLRDRRIAADVAIVDLHLGYFRSRAFETRLREDVLAPARAQGYQSVWLAGISLGGFGSLMVSRLNAGLIDGVIAMAPYVARTSVLKEVQAAGGLAQWNAPVAEGDFERDLLRWLKGYGDPGVVAREKRPAIYIGYGREDGFADFNAAVGKVLPVDRVREVPGGHDWPPWKQLWGEFLDQVPLPRLP